MSIQNAFAASKAEVKVLPKLNCLGKVVEVQPSTITPGNYIGQGVKLVDSLGKTSFASVYYRPEWLRTGFNHESLKAEPNGKNLFLTYQINIGGVLNDDGTFQNVPTLGGLCGSQANYSFVGMALQEIANTLADDEVPQAVEDYLRAFFNENDVELGYYSSQRYDKRADGTKVPAAGKRTVSGFFWPSEETHARNIADANKGRSVMAYEA